MTRKLEMHLFLLLHVLYFLRSTSSTDSHPTPSISPTIQQCFQPRSMDTSHTLVRRDFPQLVGCFEHFNVHLSAYTSRTYREAQPTPLERSQWMSIIRRMLDIERIDACETLASDILNQGMEIGRWYRVVVFKDPDPLNAVPEQSKSYCLFHETTTKEGHKGRSHFTKGWGSFAVRLSHSRPRWSTRGRPAVMPICLSSLDPVCIPGSRYTLLDPSIGVGIVSEDLSSSLPRQPPLIHFSAPHPLSDHNSPEQAAYLFSTIPFAKSLLIAGRHRRSFTVDTWHDSDPNDTFSQCFVKPPHQGMSSESAHPISGVGVREELGFEDEDEGDSGQDQSTLGNSVSRKKSTYHKTDAAHDDTQPFWDAVVAVWEWQNDHHEQIRRQDGVFIQLHGKGSKTCPEDDMFLSAGFGLHPDSQRWYLDQTNQFQTPFHKLLAALQESFTSPASCSSSSSNSTSSSHPRRIPPSPQPPPRISFPPTSPTCPLRATHNIFGRLVNGVPKDQVCFTPASSYISPSVDDGSGFRTNLTARRGLFIHAEQAPWVRLNERMAYERWRQAIVKAFGVH